MTSTYIKKPPFLDFEKNDLLKDIKARPLLILGDSITTDHISPAGVIKEDSSAGKYLRDRQIKLDDFNSYGARRGNHEVMTRGTFANIRIKNKMVSKFGGYTKHYKNDKENGQNKMNGGLSSETVKPREDLPPLLVNLAERERERVHWTGTAFGLTSELYRFWSKSGYEPIYVRQVPSDITGEHSCVMLRVCNANDSDDDDAPEGNWLAPFTDDFRVRFRSLLGAPFRELSPSLALSVLNPQVQYDDNDKQSGAGRDAVIRTDNEILSPHDLRRLEKYSSSLVDHHVITDLVPPITRAYFAKRIPATLSYAQAAILLGMGLQQRTLDDSSKQLDLPAQQVMALFNKAMRRIYGALKLGRVKEIEAALPSYVMPNLTPHAVGVDEDLQEGYVFFLFIFS